MPSTDTLAASLDADARHWLLQAARSAIAARLNLPSDEPGPPPQGLTLPAACFVTLHRQGQLRGCIGTLEAERPLHRAVAHFACAAAFEDPRFDPLSAAEWPDVTLEVSVLSSPQPVEAESDEQLLAALVPGQHGLIIAAGYHRATFLPQVWEQLPDPQQFLLHLRRKAGLPDQYPVSDMDCSIYTVTCFGDDER